MNPDVGGTKENGKKAGENIGGGEAGRRKGVEAGPSQPSRLALGAQFQILHWQFESQGRGSQGVDHVLVTLPTVLS